MNQFSVRLNELKVERTALLSELQQLKLRQHDGIENIKSQLLKVLIY